MTLTLQQPVETLAQLRACLQLLLDISDLQNSIDDHYVPIERMYELLKYVGPPVLMVFNLSWSNDKPS